MQHILGLVRRCVEDYNMIEAGETVAVGVSGGKDSLLTLAALARLREFYPKPFEVQAITLETGMPETGNTPEIEKTDIKRFREKRRTGKREADEAAAGQNGQYGAAEGSETMPESAYEMIIAVANQGYIEPIMEAARSAGAGGGTVIHAKGTGMEGMGKFFGVSLAAEKEMIFIVTERGQKQAIMRAIMEKAGMESKARTFLFSVPVDEVAGLDTSSR